jgi:uncharacterized membrane protein YbhN (UPF0104 family)
MSAEAPEPMMQAEEAVPSQPGLAGGSDGSSDPLARASAPEAKAKRKRPWLRALRAAVSVGLLGYVLYATLTHQGVGDLLERLRDVRPLALSFAFAFQCVAVLLGAVRWGVLLRAEGLELTFSWLLRHMLIGRFVGAFTPSTTGLDGYRLVAVAKQTGAALSASRAMVLEKVAGLAGLAAVTVLCAALGVTGVSHDKVWYGVALALACSVAGYIMVRRPARVASLVPNVGPLKRLRKMLSEIAGSTASNGSLLSALVLGLVSHAATAAVFVASARAVQVDLSLSSLFGVGNALVIATLVPISVGGVGVREYVAAALLGTFGVATGPAVLVSVVGYVVGQLPAILGGLFAVTARDDAR